MITEDHYRELDHLLKVCVENPALLNDWENDFISDWVDKIEEWETKVNISDKQQAIFDRIRLKLQNAGEL